VVNTQPTLKKKGRKFVMLAGFVAVCAIALLTINITREIRLLGSAQSDNLQWSLAQTQVEFLKYTQQIDGEPVDLAQLRQEFDVFYSRVTTVQQASVFADLRANEIASGHLDDLQAYLNSTVAIIDAPDGDLLRQIPELSRAAQDIAPTVRALGHSGLDIIARSADTQREAVVLTIARLAFAIAALIGVLLMAILFLNGLNARIYRRERENKQTSARMTTVMSTSLDGVIVSDSDGLILEFSPAAEGIFGYLESEVLGKDIGSVIVPDHFRDAHDAGIERMQARVVGKGRVTLEAKDREGRIFPVELALQSATTDQGDIFIAFVRDISHRVAAQTELVAARDKALASEKLKTDFLSTMSHEIRTPLNGLLGNLNLLRDTELDSKQARYIGYMETSGRLLMSHISDVLDITRYDAGKLNTQSEPVNISALVQDIVDNQNSTAAKNETWLTWSWQGERMDWVMSDHDRLQHVMMNLIGNAVKFTRRGAVAVTIENVGDENAAELLVKIADTGPGMTEELTKHVFDDFVTGNTAYDRDVGGTGLGLSIAKRFVHALGGEIGVDSAVGEGSTFWVKIPASHADAPQENRATFLPETPNRSLTVLLVEDNEINRFVAREMLQSEGHIVVEALNGKQGVEASKATKFDLILMDISMPVMDGRAAARAIRSEDGASKHTTIFALTANAMIEEQQEFIADGMNGIMTKPLSRDALRDLLNRTGGPSTSEESLRMINNDHIAETRDALGEEAFVKLRSRFVSEVDDFQDWLGSQDVQDYLAIADHAHKVAGSAAVFGADHLRFSLKDIENAAKVGDVATINDKITDFGGIWKQTKSQMMS
jgi:PAS domain S-box-containing protein